MAGNQEDKGGAEAQILPTPSDITFRTPSRNSSRHSTCRRDSSPGPSPGMSSSPDFPLQTFSPEGRPDIVEFRNDGMIPPLDPRRFTPTLHASLVSEILSLRRELESKTRVIDALESSLDDSRTENEALNESLSKSSKEARSLKRQMQLLEGGTLSAITELAKERDEALESMSDVRKRLEQAQKKARTQEEEVERIQMLWDRDKQTWEGERRNLEHKVHVVEGRLKTVLNEIAVAQAAGSSRHHEEERGQSVKDSPAQHSDATSVRSFGRRRASTTSLSTLDGERYRFSVSSVANGLGPKMDGLSLAEELAFSDAGEDYMDESDDDPDSPGALPEERPSSVHSHLSHIVGMKARKILGLSMDSGVQRYGNRDSLEQTSLPSECVRALTDGGKSDYVRPVEYRDIGIQYSPPPSPQLPPPVFSQLAVSPEDRTPSYQEKHAANEGRKRAAAAAAAAANSYQTKDSGTVTATIETVSTSCQTVGDLPTPPWSPELSESAVQTVPDVKQVVTISTSTQTEEKTAQGNKEKLALVSSDEQSSALIQIPMIAIHPPESEPTSTRNSVVLPPQTKSIACQTNFRSFVEGRSIGMQTEEIRVDKRPVKLPASLLPSAIPDQQPSTDSNETIIQPYRPPPPRSAKRPLRSPVIESSTKATKASKSKQADRVDAYPGNNDNGPLSGNLRLDIRRPLRSSSLFAGFSDDEALANEADIFSDDDLFSRPTASYTLRRGKLVSKKGRSSFEDSPLPELDEPDLNSDTETNSTAIGNGASSRSLGRRRGSQRSQQPSKAFSGSRAQDIRRTALISSGTAAHQAPSIDSCSGSSIAPRPPFPVPIRLSSRNVPLSGSEGAQSPTPYSAGLRSERGGRPMSKTPTLRKVRSASAISISEQPEPERLRSRSPPPMPASSLALESPGPSPISLDDIPSRHRRVGKKQSSQYTASSRTYSYGGDSTVASSVQQTSVVDAIAQTMVGEWMFKYVRRRKSFGVPESKDGWDAGKNPDETSANITNNGVRHKRWVWLAPYERAVMWSSKQPTSGTALLGKSGRKLIIQSVLDVKDDNPLPKGAAPESHFHRSILILTPERALKFTAMTLERHFVWLTALSFLSHSAIGVNDLRSIPPTPQGESASPPPVRRKPIRDSIKVSKSRSRLVGGGNRSFTAQPPVPEIPLDKMSMDSTMDAADPPSVPRFSAHSRKRSNTAPRLAPLALRSFSSQATMTSSTHSTMTAHSSDLHGPYSAGVPGFNSDRSSFSRRTSVASGFSSNTGNFFEAVGTVRMEAFIEHTNHMQAHRGGYGPRHTMRKRDSSQWGSGQHSLDFARSETGSETSYRTDPFRGF